MDNGYSINVMLIHMIKKLGIKVLKLVSQKCQGCYRNKKALSGIMTLLITLEDKIIQANIFVLDIDIDYKPLLGHL